MKYTLIKRVTFNYKGAEDSVSVIKEANSLEDVLKYKVGAEMLEEPADNKKFEVLININDVFTYINAKPEKPLLLTDEVKGQKSIVMAELREEHFEVIDSNKAKNFDRENTAKLNQAREIYNRTNGLQNISEHELRKFNTLMKYQQKEIDRENEEYLKEIQNKL